MDESLYRVMYETEEAHWWFRGRRAVLEALMDRADPPVGARALDAGCGTGRNLELLARYADAEGIDPSAQAVEFCHRRGLTEVRQGDVQDLPFEDGRFGLVWATDVLEHVDDDSAALRELRRVTVPGAALVITVPAYRWLWSAEDDRLQHRRRYTLASLRGAAQASGWQPVFGTYFNLLLLPPIAMARKLSGDGGRRRPELERTPAWLDGPLSLPLRLEARAIRRGLRLPAGVSSGLVCRRA